MEIVRRLCEPCLERVHAGRFRAVLRAVEGLIVAQRVSLTAIGRAVRGKLQPRHGIKMMDRLLGNPKLEKERRCWFAALAQRLVGTEQRVVLLLDWTQLHGEFWALVAAIVFEGRSIPIFGEAHHESKLGSREVQTKFLHDLCSILPKGCRPLIVADGGFRSPFFAACHDASIDFVVRLRNDRAMARIPQSHCNSGYVGSAGVRFDEIFRWAKRKAQCLGISSPFITSPFATSCRMVLGPAPKKAHRRLRYLEDYERKRGCEPWLLATSLDNESAETIVAIYATRMQVEECFRDAKNARFGWGLEFAKSTSTERLNVLLVLVAIAFAAIVLVGAAAFKSGLEKRFRASSREERVLSLFSLGNLVARDAARVRLRFATIWRNLESVSRVSRLLLPPLRAFDSVNRSNAYLSPNSRVVERVHHDYFCSDCGWRSTAIG